MNMAIKPPSNVISSKALIVYLSISAWSGRKLDREVTDEVNKDHGAKADASRLNKQLLAPDAMASITKIISSCRTDFVAKTLPWMTDGGRIMPASSYREHAQWMKGEQQKFFDAVNDFCRAYPGHVTDARARLGTMFKAQDYPTAGEIRDKFDMKMNVLPVPSGKDFRVDIAGEELAALRADVEANVEKATQAAMGDIFKRVAEVTGAMVERLSAYKPSKGKGTRAEGTFRDSLVGNVRDLVGIMPALNLTDDPRVGELVQRLDALSQTGPQELRDSDKARSSVKAEAERIFATVADWL